MYTFIAMNKTHLTAISLTESKLARVLSAPENVDHIMPKVTPEVVKDPNGKDGRMTSCYQEYTNTTNMDLGCDKETRRVQFPAKHRC